MTQRGSDPKVPGALAGLFVLPVICCVGLVLLVGAGLSASIAIAIVAGALFGGIVLLGALVLLAVRIRRRRAAQRHVPTHQIGDQL